MARFQRTKFRAYVKLGSRQKSKLRYVRCRGRHNKTRQKEKSHPMNVEIGFKQDKRTSGKINGKVPVIVYNTQGLGNLKKENIAIIGNVSIRKKIEIAKMALQNNIEIYAMNAKKFVAKMEKKMKGTAKVEAAKEIKEIKHEGKKQ